MTILADLLRQVVAELRAAGVADPVPSTRIIAAHVLGVERPRLLLMSDVELVPEIETHIRQLIARRAAGEPVAYIVGRREFYGLDFAVDPRGLIPRPETETLVEAVRERIPVSRNVRFADLGTGSGAIGVTLATLYPASRGVLVDVNPGTLELALANARTHGVADRLDGVLADMRLPLFRPRSLDVLVSNPPYVAEAEFASLMPGVRNFEPRAALVAGQRGTEFYAALAPLAAAALGTGGMLALEIGPTQAAEVVSLLTPIGFDGIEVLSDLGGHSRVITAMKA